MIATRKIRFAVFFCAQYFVLFVAASARGERPRNIQQLEQLVNSPGWEASSPTLCADQNNGTFVRGSAFMSLDTSGGDVLLRIHVTFRCSRDTYDQNRQLFWHLKYERPDLPKLDMRMTSRGLVLAYVQPGRPPERWELLNRNARKPPAYPRQTGHRFRHQPQGGDVGTAAVSSCKRRSRRYLPGDGPNCSGFGGDGRGETCYECCCKICTQYLNTPQHGTCASACTRAFMR